MEPKPAKSFKKIIRDVYKKSNKYKVDKLLEEETRWKRKKTIAENKLVATRKKINSLLIELGNERK